MEQVNSLLFKDKRADFFPPRMARLREFLKPVLDELSRKKEQQEMKMKLNKKKKKKAQKDPRSPASTHPRC